MDRYLSRSLIFARNKKNISIKDYKHARLDVIIGSFVVTIIAGFIILTCAATLFKAGIRVETAAD